MNKAQFGILAKYYLEWIKQYQTKDCGTLNHCNECVLEDGSLECGFNVCLIDTKEFAKDIVKKYEISIEEKRKKIRKELNDAHVHWLDHNDFCK